MSYSRFAAIGLALVAGVTLASCASSSSPLPATGPNPQTISFPGGSARVHFIMGSPNVNLGVNNTDLYIDNQLVFAQFLYAGCEGPGAGFPCNAFPVIPFVPALTGGPLTGPVTPYIEMPIGNHEIKLTQHGTLAPVFLDQVIKFSAGQKLAVIAEGDAAYHTTTWAVFVEPVYNTPAGIRAASVFNASPNAGTIDFWYTCPAAASCGDGTHTGTALATGVTVGTAAAPTSSWKNNVLLKASTTGSYCFGTYSAGSAGPPIPFINAAAGPPFADIPTASANDPRNIACTSQDSIGPGTDNNFYIIDMQSVAPRIPPHGPSTVLWVPDSNG